MMQRRGKSRFGLLLALAVGALAGAADSSIGQGIRDRTRPNFERADAVSETQAAEITLTVTPATRQLLQTWVRTAGVLDETGRNLTACVNADDAALLAAGQRIRAFAPDSKSSIYQARITALTPGETCSVVEARLSGPTYGDATRFVMEIIVDRGYVFAISNTAIIEREGKQVVYVQLHPGHYDRREIQTGLKGELYTEVLSGLSEGEEVVTIGSFFVDADYQLSLSGGSGMGAHHHH